MPITVYVSCFVTASNFECKIWSQIVRPSNTVNALQSSVPRTIRTDWSPLDIAILDNLLTLQMSLCQAKQEISNCMVWRFVKLLTFWAETADQLPTPADSRLRDKFCWSREKNNDYKAGIYAKMNCLQCASLNRSQDHAIAKLHSPMDWKNLHEITWGRVKTSKICS